MKVFTKYINIIDDTKFESFAYRIKWWKSTDKENPIAWIILFLS